ncbi:MAG: MATE family efflux transporter [Clostridia bacterium]|nr:MATE family efflux transporter [Clostridia bacterium]
MKSGKRSIASELIFFSLPLILSGVLQQLYSWADAFIVGHYEGQLQLAAIGGTGAISTLLINTILGFTLGLSIMGAQEFGRGNTSRIRRILSCYLPILTSVYTALSVLVLVFLNPILRIMDTPSEIFGYSLSYLRIILIGIPFLACYNLFTALLRAVGNTKAAFYSVLLSSVLNVLLDILLVAVLPFGVAGAAWATVFSQFAMTVFIIIYTIRKYPDLIPAKDEPRFDKSVFLQGGAFSLPPTIQNSITSFGNLVLQNFMNGFGAATVLAITTAYRVDCIMLLPIVNLGAAVSSMIARAHGAGDSARIRSCLKTSLLLMICIAVSLSLVMYLFGAEFVAVFGVSGEALAVGKRFFQDLSIFYTLFGISVVLRSTLEGIGDITFSSAIGIAMLALRILFSYVLRPYFAERTIALAEGFAWIIMLALFILRMLYVGRKKTSAFRA